MLFRSGSVPYWWQYSRFGPLFQRATSGEFINSQGFLKFPAGRPRPSSGLPGMTTFAFFRARCHLPFQSWRTSTSLHFRKRGILLGEKQKLFSRSLRRRAHRVRKKPICCSMAGHSFSSLLCEPCGLCERKCLSAFVLLSSLANCGNGCRFGALKRLGQKSLPSSLSKGRRTLRDMAKHRFIQD